MIAARSVLSVFAASLLALTGCGDDKKKSSNAEGRRRPRAAKKAAAAPAATASAAEIGYPKVPDELRVTLTEMSFVPDNSGESNRDPFRSFLLTPAAPDEEPTVKRIDVCTESGDEVAWEAESYSVRDLNLIGIVKRGRSFAQFTDGSDADSWIVRKGDCIGQEKAIVEEIGVGYVRLSITPPAPPGAPAPPAQKQDIRLHPEELDLPSSRR